MIVNHYTTTKVYSFGRLSKMACKQGRSQANALYKEKPLKINTYNKCSFRHKQQTFGAVWRKLIYVASTPTSAPFVKTVMDDHTMPHFIGKLNLRTFFRDDFLVVVLVVNTPLTRVCERASRACRQTVITSNKQTVSDCPTQAGESCHNQLMDIKV